MPAIAAGHQVAGLSEEQLIAASNVTVCYPSPIYYSRWTNSCLIHATTLARVTGEKSLAAGFEAGDVKGVGISGERVHGAASLNRVTVASA